ncbi:hypothetical protein H6P87_00607 [Rickettsia tillamookensis]|uniref:3'-5' exonuclease domain-containing protein n=1 Tax=Rickettsia tillamookensis TaxID=2761623 RepID=A0A9E6MHC9_9RICK|nr:hypothetical protein H6P87_00607 [Rickettsia tillamookensis]
MNIKIYQDDLPNNFELEGDIAIDTETMGLNLHRDKLCLLQFSNGNGEAHLVHFVNQDYTAPNLLVFLVVLLDTVDKPRYDTEQISRAMQQRRNFLAMTLKPVHATMPTRDDNKVLLLVIKHLLFRICYP